MRKKLSRIILSIVVLLVLAVVLVVLLIDPIAKGAVEKGATYALGVKTTVDSLDIRLLNGQLVMDGLNISNPEGFVSPHLARSGKFDVQIKTGTLFSDTVQISEFQLDGLDLNIEQKISGSNVSTVIDNIKRLSKDKETSKGPSKKVVVDHLLIKNVVAHFHLLSGADTLEVQVPTIERNNVASEGSAGIAAQMTIEILPAILKAVIEKAGGIVPSGLLKDLDSQMQGLTKELGEQAEQLKKQMKQLKIDEPIKDTGKSIQKGVGELGEGLFGPKKKQTDSSD